MAAESGGPNMRSPCQEQPSSDIIEEQAIDLSKHNNESLRMARDVPPLIPINRHILKKRWIAQNQMKHDTNSVNVPHTLNLPSSISITQTSIKNSLCKKRRADEMINDDDAASNKSTRDEDSRNWDLRLDRAHSVPHLRSLPPLLRCKSLSESRIAPNSYSTQAKADENLSNDNNRPVAWLLEQEQELQRQRLQQMQIKLVNIQQTSSAVSKNDTGEMLKNMPNYDSLMRAGYYTQMLQCFQAQEWLKQYSLHRQPDQDQENTIQNRSSGAAEVRGEEIEGGKVEERSEVAEQEEDLLDAEDSAFLQEDNAGALSDENELRRRSNRPLTGRHVRYGTGASPATLLSLRKKIQARQQLRGCSSSKAATTTLEIN